MYPTHPKSTWVQLCLVLLISLATESNVISPSFSPILFAEAAPTDNMSEEERAEKREKMRLASEFLEKQRMKEAREAMRSAAEAGEKLKKETDAKKKRQAQQQRQKQQYTQAEKEDRRRRAEEYLKWKEQREKQQEEEENEDFSYFVTPKPRDLFEGTTSAISNLFRGGFYGLAAFLGTPFSFAATEGLVGFVKGIVAGVVLGAGMPIAGVGVALFQLGRGFIAQPIAFRDGFIGCKVWNETGRSWEEYRMDDDIKFIREALDEEEKKTGKSREDKNEYSSSKKVKSTELYDLLGVKPDATTSNIRSAYRKKAREVHPDKNPDDPDAEKKFREVSAAYQTLSDPAARKQYDSSGVGVNPEQAGGGQGFKLDPYVFFAVLFGSEQVENYIGELGLASSFDHFMKLAEMGDGSTISFDSWDDVKSVLGWNEASLKRRKRETEIAIFLRERISDYVDGLLTGEAFAESCRQEAESIASGEYGTSFLSAIGPALIAEADSFLGYRASVIGLWRGPVSGIRRKILSMRRKFSFAKALLRTVKEGFKALSDSAEVVPDGHPSSREQKVRFEDKVRLKDNFSNTIPSIINMVWAINFIDISNTLASACTKLFYDASVTSSSERLRRAEGIQILGSQFYLVAMEITGGNTTITADIDDIKARASNAFTESMKKGMEKEQNEGRSGSDEM